MEDAGLGKTKMFHLLVMKFKLLFPTEKIYEKLLDILITRHISVRKCSVIAWKKNLKSKG